MLPKYRELLKYDLSILVFSGDVDAVVPVSLSWKQSLLNSVMTPRRSCNVRTADWTEPPATGRTLSVWPWPALEIAESAALRADSCPVPACL